MVSNARLAARILARVLAESVPRPSASSSGRSAVLQQAAKIRGIWARAGGSRCAPACASLAAIAGTASS